MPGGAYALRGNFEYLLPSSFTPPGSLPSLLGKERKNINHNIRCHEKDHKTLCKAHANTNNTDTHCGISRFDAFIFRPVALCQQFLHGFQHCLQFFLDAQIDGICVINLTLLWGNRFVKAALQILIMLHIMLSFVCCQSCRIHNAVTRAKEYCKAKGKNLKIELEVRNFDELQQALDEGVDRIMFDNFSPEDTKKAVEIVAGRCETESSGGITYETMLPYAQAGVDYISFGALTHSVKGMDMSFKAC